MIDRRNWSQDLDEVIRSRHYTWLGLGLGGEAIEDAMTVVIADIMHICQRRGIPWEAIVEKSRKQFEREERELARQKTTCDMN